MGRDLSGPSYFEGRLSDWLMKYFDSIGANCERIDVVEGRSNVIARYDSPGGTRTMLWDAHQDTVPVDTMTIAPFDAQISDGRISGRGAADVKGGLAAMLHAFTKLMKERPARAANVVLSCTCDEEHTMLGMRDLVTYWESECTKSRLLSVRPDVAVVAEPTELNVVIAHRGVIRFRVHTIGRACHSSDPTLGRNAIYTMARAVCYLEDYASWLPKSVPFHPLCGRPTLSVGRIVGGQSVNIVPDKCTIEIDRRLIPGEDPLVAWSTLREKLMERFGPNIAIDEPWISSPGLNNQNNLELAEALLKCATNTVPSRRSLGVAYCTHAATLSAAGVPAVVFGPGAIEQAHTVDEFIAVEQLDQAAAIYFDFACASL